MSKCIGPKPRQERYSKLHHFYYFNLLSIELRGLWLFFFFFFLSIKRGRLTMSAILRSTSSIGEASEFEQLIQENEMMLAEISALRPECEKNQRQLKILQAENKAQERRIVALEQERECMREESDRLRTIVASRDKDSHVSHSHRAEQSEVIINTFRETTDQHHKRLEDHLFNIRGDIQLVLAMQQQSAATAGHADATKAAADAAEAAHQELRAARQELAQRTDERDEALERIRLMQAQWEASRQETQALTKEKLTLRERADQLVASANVAGSDVAHLLADIFDNCEAETMELKNKVATREMLRNDDKQCFAQELGRLQRANKELNMRLQRALKMVEEGGGNGSPLSTLIRTSDNNTGGGGSAAAVHFDAAAPPAGGSSPPADPGHNNNTRRLTLSRSEDGQLTARNRTDSSPQHTTPPAAVAAGGGSSGSSTPGRVVEITAAAYREVPPPSITGNDHDDDMVQCPRCTFDNEPGSRVCAVCNMQLVARQRAHHR
jgi:hypothetical protein